MSEEEDWLSPRPVPPPRTGLGSYASAADVLHAMQRHQAEVGLAFGSLNDAWKAPENYAATQYNSRERQRELAWQLTNLLGATHGWIRDAARAAREWQRRVDVLHSSLHPNESFESRALCSERTDEFDQKKDDGDDDDETPDSATLVFATASADTSRERLRELEIRLLTLERRVRVRCDAIRARIVAATPARIDYAELERHRELETFTKAVSRAKTRLMLQEFMDEVAQQS
jgi:hypothetical protein